MRLSDANARPRESLRGRRTRIGTFGPGQSHTDVPFSPRAHRIPRGTIKLVLNELMNDDGTLQGRLAAEPPSFRTRLMPACYAAVEAGTRPGADPADIRVALAVSNDIADRLEGKGVAKIQTPVYPQAIFYRAGD